MAASHHDATLHNAASSYTTSVDSTGPDCIRDTGTKSAQHAASPGFAVYLAFMTDGEAPVPSDATQAPIDVSRYAYLELTGDRFDAIGMPVDAMREVSNFRDAIVAEARESWIKQHPGRARVPNGFVDSFDLRLVRIDEGSARPVLYLNTSQSDDPENELSVSPYFATAVSSIAVILQEVNRDGFVPSRRLSSEVERTLRKVGATLGAGETLTFGDATNKERRAKVDATTIEVLQRIDNEVGGPEAVDLIGFIVEYDSVGRSFRLVTATGSSVCNLSPNNLELTRLVKEYLAPDGFSAPDVIISGYSNNRSSRSPTVDEVFKIAVHRRAEDKVLISQVRAIQTLHPGWLTPGSMVPDKVQFKRALRVAEMLIEIDIGANAVPASTGAIVFEWSRDPVEMTASIEPGNRMFLCVDNVKTDDLIESDSQYDEQRLLNFVRTGEVGD